MAVAVQRPLRGSRISSFYPIKSLPSLSSLDSAFQLQEYISLLIRLDVHDVDTIVSVPGKASGKDKSEDGGEELNVEKEVEKERKSDIAVDEACWIYEQLRRLAQDLSHPLITMLQHECTRASCPEMKAGEWLYLCVAHGNDGAMEQCCAIDYILHTLDSATALLNSPRAFPSRLQIPQASHRHFASLARRLGRIFAHAYFHHREAFEQAEAESSLYARFLALTSKFELVPSEFLVIPIPSDGGTGRDADVEPPRLLAASVGPHRAADQNATQNQQVELGSDIGIGEWEKVDGRGKSPPGLGSPLRDISPRRYGRSRTDTMVFNEPPFSEELSKGDKKGTDESQAIQGQNTGEPELVGEIITSPVDEQTHPVAPFEEQLSSRDLDIQPDGKEDPAASSDVDIASLPARSGSPLDDAEAMITPSSDVMAENIIPEQSITTPLTESTIPTESSKAGAPVEGLHAPELHIEDTPTLDVDEVPEELSLSEDAATGAPDPTSSAFDTNAASGNATAAIDQGSEASASPADTPEVTPPEISDEAPLDGVKPEVDMGLAATDDSDLTVSVNTEAPPETPCDVAKAEP